MSVAIAWFRRDLRLTDNPALEDARAAADVVIPVYIHAPDEEGPWPPGAASRWWLHRSLSALATSLGKRGSGLVSASPEGWRNVLRRGKRFLARRPVVRRGLGADCGGASARPVHPLERGRRHQRCSKRQFRT